MCRVGKEITDVYEMIRTEMLGYFNTNPTVGLKQPNIGSLKPNSWVCPYLIQV